MIKSNQFIENIIKSSNLIFMQIHPVVIWVNLQFALPFTFRSFKSAIEFLKISKI